MTTTYGIRVVHEGRETEFGALSQAVARQLESTGLHRSVNITVTTSEVPPGTPHICVCLCDENSKKSDVIQAALAEELTSGITVFPVLEDLDRFGEFAPQELTHANGILWSDERSLQHLVHTLLEELGIEEKHRRVFISHRRTDGLGAAEQFHDELSHFKFRPFIDRFAIREGANFQQEIGNALEDHAFLLLLESPDAHNSAWVFDEVDYALSHTMGILILRWPGEVQEVPGSAGLPRLFLGEEDIVEDDHGYSVLTKAALERVLEEVERAHARGIVRRRNIIVKSISEAAEAAGVEGCTSLSGWQLLISTNKGTCIVGTTPRLPTAIDLQILDRTAMRTGASLPSILVHSARTLPSSLQEHLEWVSSGRRMAIIPENAIGGWWHHVN